MFSLTWEFEHMVPQLVGLFRGLGGMVLLEDVCTGKRSWTYIFHPLPVRCLLHAHDRGVLAQRPVPACITTIGHASPP